jgi:hypothetical protein
MSYASLDDLRNDPALKLAEGETADDELLSDLLTAVQQFIDTQTGFTFEASGDTTRHFDARHDVTGRTLYLNAPLAALTSIVNGDGETLDPADYVTEPRDLLSPNHADYRPIWAVRLKSSSDKAWTYEDDPENAISVTGRWAYSQSVPQDIKRACIIGAAALYRQSLSGDNDRPIIAGGGTVIEPSRLPATFWNIINSPRYTRFV